MNKSLMNKVMSLAILFCFSFSLTAQAGLDRNFKPVEQELIETERELEQQIEESLDITRAKEKAEKERQMAAKAEQARKETPKSKKWYWIIGGLLIAGGAAAAGGGGGGGSSGGSDTGTVVVSY